MRRIFMSLLLYLMITLSCDTVHASELPERFCMAVNDSLVYKAPDESAVAFDVVKSQEAFYVDGEDGDFYHVVSDWDFYVKKSDVITGDELVNWLKTSDKFPMEARVVEEADIRMSGKRGVYSTVEVGTLFQVEKLDAYNVQVFYEDEICFISRSKVHFVYRVPEHAFVDSVQTLLDSVTALNEALQSIQESLDRQLCDDTRKSIVNEAFKYLGNPYVWGGTNPNTGADCSGYVKYVFKQFGISLPRVSYSQCNSGRSVEVADAKPGDLLFFWNNKYGRIGHVAMYIGDNKQIEAKGVKYGICVSDVDWSSVNCIRNVID